MVEHRALARHRRLLRLGLGVARLAGAGPVAAGSASFNVRLRVPVECFVQTATQMVVNDGGQAFGNVVEACNVPGGYIVTATYRTLASDEGAVLQYNGQTVNLPASGTAVVRVSNLATIKQVAYELTSQHLDAPLAINLNIHPAA